MMRAFAFVLLLPTVEALASSAGKGFGSPRTTTPPDRKAVAKPSYGAFRAWAEKEGAKALVPLEIGEFAGERGVGATQTVEAGATILQVPARISLQVNTLSKPPRWFKDDEAWAASKWDHRLAMLLLHEDGDASSELKPWLAQLPREFCTPALMPGLLSTLDSLECFGPICKAARAQRAEWDAARARAPGAPTQADFDWAMSVVRSRSFSGPFTPSTFVGSLTALFGAATLALGYALFVGGAGAADTALNGLESAVVFILLNDFVFGPRFTRAKRYVLCPWIDFLNHDGALSGAEVSYEYFADAFSARLDLTPGPDPESSCSSRTDRAVTTCCCNTMGLQAANPHDTFQLEQERLILDIDAVLEGGLPSDALATLAAAKLTDASRVVELTGSGADKVGLRLARLLTHPALASRRAASALEAGIDPLPPAEEAQALRALASAATMRRKALADVTSTGARGMPEMAGEPAYASELLVAYLEEKCKVLGACATALEAQAARSA